MLALHGGGWANPNITGKKTKTFTAGLPMKRKGDKVHADGAGPEKPMEEQPASSPTPGIVVTDSSEPEHPDDPRFLHSHDHTKAHWKTTLWEDVHVGDFVMLRSDDPIPADILILSTSEDENVAFVETKNLDGETNLKSRHGIQEFSHLRTPHDLSQAQFTIDVEAPQVNMFQLNGAINMKDDQKYPIDLQTVLLRGTVVRNTRWCLGVVLFTGQDTKIVQNSGLTPSKRSKVERQMNPQV